MKWNINVKSTSDNAQIFTTEWAVIDVLSDSFAIFFNDKNIPSSSSKFKTPTSLTVDFVLAADSTIWSTSTKTGLEKKTTSINLSGLKTTTTYKNCADFELESSVTGILSKSSYKLFTGGEYTYSLSSTYLK